jgi:Bacterial archaeo-eukaryotic release factor family 3
MNTISKNPNKTRVQSGDKYLLLVQSADMFKIFLGDKHQLMKLKLETPDNVNAYKNDMPEKVENFSDSTDKKEVMLDKFIHHIDKELESVLNKYHLPVFIIGPEKMNGHFKKYTHNSKAILGYIHGNHDDAKMHQLLQLVQPSLKELNNIENKEIATKIEKALSANKFSFGLDEVWTNVMDNNGNILLVERNYVFPQNQDGVVADAVPTLIERVFESGGEVLFVDPEIMKDYKHIALFLYY